MAKLGEVLNSLALKAGIAADHADLKAFLSDPACSTLEVPDTLVTGIGAGLMNEDAAINNKRILDKARAEAYNKVDETLLQKVQSLLDDSDNEVIKGHKFTVDKIGEIGKVIAKLKDAKKDTGSNVDKAVYQKQIDDLHAQLKAEKQALQDVEANYKNKYEADSIDSSLRFSLSGKNYKLPMETEADKQFATDIALQKVKAELNSKGYKLVRDNGAVKLLDKDNLEVHDSQNTKVGLQMFIDGAIAQLIAPVKKVEQEAPPAGGGNRNLPKGNESAKANMAELMKSMEAPKS